MKGQVNKLREVLVRARPRMRSARSRESWSLATAAAFPGRSIGPQEISGVLASELPRRSVNSGARNNK